MYKKIFIFSVLAFSLTTKTYAADMVITCETDGPCERTSGDSFLFNETVFAPGDSIIKSFDLVNEDDEDICDADMALENFEQGNVDFSNKLTVEIKRDGDTIYGPDKTLQGLLDHGTLGLGDIEEDDTESYTWKVTFDSSSGNEYQGATLIFDFDLIFSCDHEEEEQEPEVAGISSFVPFSTFLGIGATTPEKVTEVKGDTDVKGVFSDAPEVCIFSAWLVVVLAVQLILHVIILQTDRSNKTLLQIIISIVFAFIFYKYFCQTWDVFVSIILGVIAASLSIFSRR